MSFRTRLALVAAAAVALAILTASFVIYFVVRNQLRATVDDSLRTTAGQLQGTPLHDLAHFATRPSEIGGPTIYPQAVDPNGNLLVVSGATARLPVTESVVAVARGERGAFFSDAHVQKTHLRVLTFPYPPVGAGQVARSMTEVDHSLGRIKNLLILIAGGGIAVAAALCRPHSTMSLPDRLAGPKRGSVAMIWRRGSPRPGRMAGGVHGAGEPGVARE